MSVKPLNADAAIKDGLAEGVFLQCASQRLSNLTFVWKGHSQVSGRYLRFAASGELVSQLIWLVATRAQSARSGGNPFRTRPYNFCPLIQNWFDLRVPLRYHLVGGLVCRAVEMQSAQHSPYQSTLDCHGYLLVLNFVVDMRDAREL